jgi:DNA polymerase III subunit beta
MHFLVEVKDLKRALTRIFRIVERKNTIPILSNVLISAEAGSIFLIATDLDCHAQAEISTGCVIDKPGTTTVPAQILRDIVSKFDDGLRVDCEIVDGSMTVKAGRSRFKLNTLPAEDFPLMARLERDTAYHFEIEAPVLLKALNGVSFAISSEETRYYLCGVFFHALDGKLNFVATDGHRLARWALPVPEGASGLPGIIVPKKAIGEIMDIAKTAAGAVLSISASRTRIEVSGPGILFISKLIDGTYPDYARVIPTRPNTVAIVSIPELSRMTDRVVTVASERTKGIKMSFGDGGKLTGSVRDPDGGQAIEEIDVDYGGHPIEIGFNSRYLLDILGAVEGGHARINLIDAGSPTVITPDKGEDALYVLMPMRVS